MNSNGEVLRVAQAKTAGTRLLKEKQPLLSIAASKCFLIKYGTNENGSDGDWDPISNSDLRVAIRCSPVCSLTRQYCLIDLAAETLRRLNLFCFLQRSRGVSNGVYVDALIPRSDSFKRRSYPLALRTAVKASKSSFPAIRIGPFSRFFKSVRLLYSLVGTVIIYRFFLGCL